MNPSSDQSLDASEPSANSLNGRAPADSQAKRDANVPSPDVSAPNGGDKRNGSGQTLVGGKPIPIPPPPRAPRPGVSHHPPPPRAPVSIAPPNAAPLPEYRYALPNKRPLPAFTRPQPRVWHLPTPRDRALILFAFVVLVLAAMTVAFFATRRLVTVAINENQIQLWTHQNTVRGALEEAGIQWYAEDIIKPSVDENIPASGKISIRQASPVTIAIDGNLLERRTQSSTIAAVLRENDIRLKPSDRVFLNGRASEVAAVLPRFGNVTGKPAMPASNNTPLQISVERALPITLNDNGLVSTLYTTEQTLGAALRSSGVLVYLGDYVTPDLGNPVTAGSAIFIRRSRPATITVDGRTIKTRTRATDVAGLLAQEGIQLEGKDFSNPSSTSPVVDNVNVSVTRVREVFVTETQSLAFQVRWLPNPDMEIDQRATPQVGIVGLKNRLFKSVYENGKLMSRRLEREWIARPPQDQIINYGTKITVRDLTLPDGTVVQYWRKLRLLATSYNPSSSGKPVTHPEYGKTFLGMEAGRGIVAVDPRVINLRANVYVPGYGVAFAGDTGGRIKGRRIDLGYTDDNIDLWYRWVDVYVLTPVPPKNLINFTPSDYPQETHAKNE